MLLQCALQERDPAHWLRAQQAVSRPAVELPPQQDRLPTKRPYSSMGNKVPYKGEIDAFLPPVNLL
jgi:hypothetical protein